MGDGFGIGGVTGYYSDPVKFNVASINPLSSLKFTAKSTNTTYEVLHDGQLLPEAAANGITYTVIDNANGSLALTPLFFEQLEGGINTLDFEVTDNDNNTGKASRPRSRRQTGGDCRAGPVVRDCRHERDRNEPRHHFGGRPVPPPGHLVMDHDRRAERQRRLYLRGRASEFQTG